MAIKKMSLFIYVTVHDYLFIILHSEFCFPHPLPYQNKLIFGLQLTSWEPLIQFIVKGGNVISVVEKGQVGEESKRESSCWDQAAPGTITSGLPGQRWELGRASLCQDA